MISAFDNTDVYTELLVKQFSSQAVHTDFLESTYLTAAAIVTLMYLDATYTSHLLISGN